MKVTIKEVTTKKDLREFVHYPNAMYSKEPYYVPTLEGADRDVLTPGRNHAFEFCEGKYWLALDENGRIVGRIAGIINREYNRKVNQKIARFGFIDFIDDNDVVDSLIDTVTKWAKEKGMEILNGPLGFLEFDASGVCVEGFDELPTAYGKYNFPYYDGQLKRCGFEKDTDWVEYQVTVPHPIPDKHHRVAEIVKERYHLHQADISTTKKMLGYLDEVAQLMNETYSKLHGYSELNAGQIEDLKKQFIPLLNTDFVSFVQNEDNKIVGFGFCAPSMAKAMQKTKGKLFPFGFLHILHAKRHNDTIDTLLIGVDENYRSKGVQAMIFDKIIPALEKYGIKYIETTRELEDNNNVQNMWGKLERRLHKRARCYIKNI